MLGINTNIECKDVKYPIYFDRLNICLHCGTTGSLVMMDKFDKEAREEIYPFDYIRCKKCGREFSIKWEKDKDTGKMYPCAVDPSISKQFTSFINQTDIKD